MKIDRQLLRGSGGGGKKGGGSGRVAQEDENTLQAYQSARVVDLISVGEIEGLVDGTKSIIFDDTRVKNEVGTYNFSGFAYAATSGLPDQDALPGFDSVESEVSVGVEVTASAPVVRTITDPGLDAVRVHIRVPRLTEQNTTNGDLHGASVQLAIDVMESGGAWQPVATSYAWQTFGGTSLGMTTGLRITVSRTVSGPPGTTVSTTLSARYGVSGSGSWTTVSQSVSVEIPYDEYATTGSATASYTWEITGLTAAAYAVEAVSGSLGTTQSYSPNATITISGKTTSTYEESYRIELPAGGNPWSVRVRRLTVDSESSALQNQTYWSSYTKLIDTKLMYPHCAIVGAVFDARQFSSIPRRGYEAYGIICRVPTNYDPEEATYTGLWDGSFKRAWTDNPAWILREFLVNDAWGCGIDAAKIDDAELYLISQYNDGLVSDGFGGQRRRYTMNYWFSSREDAYKVIQSIAGSFAGKVYWGRGVIVVTQDRPADPVKLVTPANVIDGTFTYSGTSLKSRHTVCLVTWNDPQDNYNAAVEVVESSPEMIERYGWNTTEVTKIGCTNRAEAHMYGRWVLDTEQTADQTVTYSAAWDHADLMPGHIIAVADPAHAGARMGGRVVSATSTTVTLDAPVTLASGETYTLSLVLPDGSVVDKVITDGPGEASTLTVSDAFATEPEPWAMWALTGSDVAPRQFRVISNVETAQGRFEITALLHDPNKYDRNERNLVLNPVSTTYLTGALSPPSGFSFEEYLYSVGGTIKSAVTFSWKKSDDARASFYEVQVKYPNEPSYSVVSNLQSGLSVDLEDVPVGDYSVRVRAVSAIGGKSAWLTTSVTLLGVAAAPADVTGLKISVVGDLATLSWTPNADLDLSHYWLKFSSATSGAGWASSVDLNDHIDATSIQVPAMVGTYLLKAVDYSGSESENAASVVSNTASLNKLNVVELVEEAPEWSGEKTNTFAQGGSLRLAYADDWFSLEDWFSGDDWFLGETGVVSSGSYAGSEIIDLGEIYTSRVSASLTVGGLNEASDWFDGGDWFADDWFAVLASAYGAVVQIATTSDDPEDENWSDWQNLVVGDYTSRAYKFRLILTSSQFGVSPLVSALSVQIDMPDRVEAGNDIACPAGGVTVTFDQAFRSLTGIAFNDQEMEPGDVAITVAKSATSFTRKYKNSSGTDVSRSFDYVAKGYGRVAA